MVEPQEYKFQEARASDVLLNLRLSFMKSSLNHGQSCLSFRNPVQSRVEHHENYLEDAQSRGEPRENYSLEAGAA